jgi:hypothetical protein
MDDITDAELDVLLDLYDVIDPVPQTEEETES